MLFKFPDPPLFIGPLLLIGFAQTLAKGPSYVVTFIVLFSATQTFGGLVGSSFFSTYQQHRTQNYQVEIIKDLEQSDPLVSQRLSTYQRSAAITTNDPALQTAQAMRTLNQVVTREAQVRAYNDVIALNGIFAIALLLWGGFNIARSKYLQRRGISRP